MTQRMRAILAMAVGVLMLVLNDTAAKWLVTRYDPLQVAFMRSLCALPMAMALVVAFDGVRGFRSRRAGVHAVRGVLVLVATVAYFEALTVLPLAEGQALLFTAPIIVAALAALFLKERVDVWRWSSVGMGFLGAVIVIRPGMAGFQPESLYALSAAGLYALIMLSARWIDERDSLWTLTFQMTLFSVLFGSVSLLGDWPSPQRADAGLFALMALLGTGGMALVSQAFRMAPASLVAPLDYTALLWASLAGWAIWGAVPDWPVYVGSAVIVASGLIVLRSRG